MVPLFEPGDLHTVTRIALVGKAVVGPLPAQACEGSAQVAEGGGHP